MGDKKYYFYAAVSFLLMLRDVKKIFHRLKIRRWKTSARKGGIVLYMGKILYSTTSVIIITQIIHFCCEMYFLTYFM